MHGFQSRAPFFLRVQGLLSFHRKAPGQERTIEIQTRIFYYQSLDESRPRGDNGRCSIRTPSALKLALKRKIVRSKFPGILFPLFVLMSFPAHTAIATLPPVLNRGLRSNQQFHALAKLIAAGFALQDGVREPD